MLFAHDTECALVSAAALVNTLSTVTGDDELKTIADLDAWLDENEFTGSREHTRAELEAVRELRPRLRQIWTADEDEAVAAVNELLAEAGALPQLVRHDGWDYHLHATAPDAPVATRLAVEAAMALVDVIRGREAQRLRGVRRRRLPGRRDRPVQEPFSPLLRRRLRQPRERGGLPRPPEGRRTRSVESLLGSPRRRVHGEHPVRAHGAANRSPWATSAGDRPSADPLVGGHRERGRLLAVIDEAPLRHLLVGPHRRPDHLAGIVPGDPPAVAQGHHDVQAAAGRRLNAVVAASWEADAVVVDLDPQLAGVERQSHPEGRGGEQDRVGSQLSHHQRRAELVTPDGPGLQRLAQELSCRADAPQTLPE